MPFTLNAPVLKVDANIAKLVDISNPQNLFNLWSMMSRCADSLPQERRLENLIWGLLIEERNMQHPKTVRSSTEDIPQLSGSVESIADEEAVDIVHPRIRCQDSCTIYPSRRDHHISSDNLEKMVALILEQNESLSPPLPEIPASLLPPKKEEQKKELGSLPALSYSGSTTTESPSKDSNRPSEHSQDSSPSLELPMIKTTTVIRGFSPAQHPRPAAFTPLRSTTDIPEPKSSPAAKKVDPKKKATFMLGFLSEMPYNSDDSRTVEVCHQKTLAPPAVVVNRSKIFQIGSLSEEDSSIKSALLSPRNPKLVLPKKATSFANNLITTIPSARSSAIIEDDEEITYDESAIEPDDDDEWEDSNEDRGANSVNEKSLFQRIDFKANLTSRRSLITLALKQNKRYGNLGSIASCSTPAILHRGRAPLSSPSPLVSSSNDSDNAPLIKKHQPRATPLQPINEVPRSTAQPKPIMAPMNGVGQQQPLALSPRTTRRNMLATELTESLQRDLLHERSQLKREHTPTNIANLKQYPQQAYISRVNGDIKASSWNEDFSRDAFGGYYSKGW